MSQPIVLEVHICDQRRSYKATFTGPEADALAAQFIKDKNATCNHVCYPWDQEDEVWATADLTVAALYPTCEHGMSLSLCYGPYHFPSAADEAAWEGR